METINKDITPEEVIEYANKCTEMIQKFIAEKRKQYDIDDIPIATNVPEGIPLSKDYLTTPNKATKNFIARMQCAITDAWCGIFESVSTGAPRIDELNQRIMDGRATVRKVKQ